MSGAVIRPTQARIKRRRLRGFEARGLGISNSFFQARAMVANAMMSSAITASPMMVRVRQLVEVARCGLPDVRVAGAGQEISDQLVVRLPCCHR